MGESGGTPPKSPVCGVLLRGLPFDVVEVHAAEVAAMAGVDGVPALVGRVAVQKPVADPMHPFLPPFPADDAVAMVLAKRPIQAVVALVGQDNVQEGPAGRVGPRRTAAWSAEGQKAAPAVAVTRRRSW